MKRVAVLLALMLAVAACSSHSGESGAIGSDLGGGNEDRAESQGPPPGVDSVQTSTQRHVIRTVGLQLQSADTQATFDQIVQLTESYGGFVGSAQVSPSGVDGVGPEVSASLRIPVDSLSTAIREFKAKADRVVAESQNAQDVSEQVVDLEARLTNLEAFEVELRALLEEVRRQPDADPEKLLRVFNELSAVRGQIEQYQAQLNQLSELTTLATVNISITQTAAAVPLVQESWAPGEAIRDAVRNLVEALQAIGNWLINFVIYVLPVLLLVVGVPMLIGLFAYRKWWKDRTPKSPPAPADS